MPAVHRTPAFSAPCQRTESFGNLNILPTIPRWAQRAIDFDINHNWKGGRAQTTVWDIPVIRVLNEGEWGHGTQKPIECMRRPIENNTDPGEYVYEPFSGSGTTFIAAERTHRKCLGVELSPVYCDTIVRRWQQETGQKATRQSDGAVFDELEQM